MSLSANGDGHLGPSRFLPCLALLAAGMLQSERAPGAPAAGAALLLPPQPAAPAPLWPLPIYPRFLTSNFMEHRDGRFHAGLDMKTNSCAGYPLLAVEVGWISRVRTSVAGYGKAVYLTGASGLTYVYAHLERFADRIGSRVRAEQRRRNRYEIELSWPEGRIKVQRGEVLGLSGQSATLGPHLHFEVRDAQQQPLNPLLHGFAVQDTFAPRILKVRAIPAEPEARVGGGLTARSCSDRRGLAGVLPALQISGAVAFTAEIQDQADARGHRLAPYGLTVTLDGQIVLQSRNQYYGFDQDAQMRLEWLSLEGVWERWLHLRPGNDLPGRQGRPWSTRPGGLSTGRHVVSLRVEDLAGNLTQISWELEVTAAPGEEDARSAWQADPIRIPLPAAPGQHERWLTPLLELALQQEGDWSAWPAVPVSGAVASGDTGSRGVLLHEQFRVFRPEAADPCLAPAALRIFPDSLTIEESRAMASLQGLYSLGAVARYEAVDWPVAGAVPVPLPWLHPESPPTAQAGVYRQAPDGSWSFVATAEQGDPEQTQVWHFALRDPGRHAWLEDRTPPWIEARADTVIILEQRGAHVAGVTPPRWPLVAIRVDDAGSGVDPASGEAWCDEERLVPEPDPPRRRILIELPDALPAGLHVLRVKLSDRAGLGAERQWILHCQRGA